MNQKNSSARNKCGRKEENRKTVKTPFVRFCLDMSQYNQKTAFLLTLIEIHPSSQLKELSFQYENTLTEYR